MSHPRARVAGCWLALLFVATTSACARGEATPPARRAFFWWRTTLDPTPTEGAALDSLHVERLYLRYFDVDLDREGRPRTLGPLAPGRPPAHVELVPVVFLRERVFRGLDEPGSSALATQVWSDARALSTRLGVRPRELELDCDWTDSTRAPYFAFLRALDRLASPAGVRLSATIRLHQVKYRERTGVPPVSRGMLMFYNMGRIGPGAADHAIFDAPTAKRYLARLADYPLPLDVALPLWSWTRHVRENKVVGLLQSTDPATLGSLDFLAAAGPERWNVTRPTFVDGEFLRAGDVLQGESVDAPTVLDAARLVASALPPSAGRTVSLFDLSDKNLARHDDENLESVFETIH